MSKPHTWTLVRYVSRDMCRYCGLMRLRNARSELAAKQPCRWWEE